jgi:hypothetical protein
VGKKDKGHAAMLKSFVDKYKNLTGGCQTKQHAFDNQRVLSSQSNHAQARLYWRKGCENTCLHLLDREYQGYCLLLDIHYLFSKVQFINTLVKLGINDSLYHSLKAIKTSTLHIWTT